MSLNNTPVFVEFRQAERKHAIVVETWRASIWQSYYTTGPGKKVSALSRIFDITVYEIDPLLVGEADYLIGGQRHG